MARSKRRPFKKDQGMTTHEYWSGIRREWKQHLKNNWDDEDLHFRNPKVIHNDYDYCDWWVFIIEDSEGYLRHSGWGYTKEDVAKNSRK